MLRRLDDLPLAGIEDLAALARTEGYRFLDRLIAEWQSGETRFDGPGEGLLAHFDGGRMIAVGGLHRDPYAGMDRVARLRRLYVAPDRRQGGVGRALVARLIDDARGRFELVRLRVPDASAAAFYEAIGFARTDLADATHVLCL